MDGLCSTATTELCIPSGSSHPVPQRRSIPDRLAACDGRIIEKSKAAQPFPCRRNLSDLAIGVESQPTAHEQEPGTQQLDHRVQPSSKPLRDVRSAKVGNGDGQDLAGRDAVEAEVEGIRVAPVHGRNYPASPVLPEASEPTAAVGIPDLNGRRPTRIQAEVRSAGREIAAYMSPARLDAIPGRLEAVVVEKEVADVANGVQSVQPGSVRQQAEVIGDLEILGKQIRDAEGGRRRQQPGAMQRVEAAWPPDPVGGAAGQRLGLSLPRPPVQVAVIAVSPLE
jgi:hypothetical protein